MAISARLRSHRSTHRKPEATQQLLGFQLQQQWFALPIRSVQRVIPLGEVYGAPNHQGISLTIYQEQELLVVDVGQRIFGVSTLETAAQQYLILVQNSQGAIAGLPIAHQPILRRVPYSAFGPLPEAYITAGNIQCVSSRTIQAGSEPLLFLLDPERLLPPQD